MNKDVKKFFKFGLILISFLLISACGGEQTESSGPGVQGSGHFKQTIYSPFETQIGMKEAGYYAGVTTEASKTVLIERYGDFGENYDSSSLGYQSEPYCRIGGDYKLNVYNDPVVVGKYNHTSILYHCQTTKDLLDMIKIPNSWEENNLILYCNDGNLINFKDQNIDFLSTKVNNYKVCIIKNLDLNSKNTIVYGFEVGNTKLDEMEEYRFNSDSKISQITYNLEFIQENSNQSYNTQEIREIRVPYIEQCSEIETSDSQFETQCNMVAQNFANVTPLVEAKSPNYIEGSIQFVNNVEYEEGNIYFSIYNYKIPISYSTSNMKFKDSKNNIYSFNYDPYYTYYYLSSTQESLDLPITTVFSSAYYSDLDLSRVTLFRQLKNQGEVYGYETVAKFKIGGSITSLKPVYKIVNTLSFEQNDCSKMLASYDAPIRNSIGIADKVVCTTNNNILINTDGIDSKSGKGSAFNLFKNIILGLKNG